MNHVLRKLEMLKDQYLGKLTCTWKLRNRLKKKIQFKKEFIGQRTNNN